MFMTQYIFKKIQTLLGDLQLKKQNFKVLFYVISQINQILSIELNKLINFFKKFKINIDKKINI